MKEKMKQEAIERMEMLGFPQLRLKYSKKMERLGYLFPQLFLSVKLLQNIKNS